MPDVVRELFSLAAAVSFDSEQENPETLVVKGFASVETVDRSGELALADEFNIKSFMSNPQLLVNHRFWIDDMGNSVAVGKPTEMFVAKLVKSDQAGMLGIKNLATGEIVDSFPESKAIDLKVGAKGLWVIAEVSEKRVADMVRRGELTAFSWRGLTKVGYQANADGTVQKVLTDIDLFEVSLVNIPDNPQALFTVSKTADGGLVADGTEAASLAVHTIRLDKSRFETVEMAKSYLDAHGLTAELCEKGGCYFATQKGLDSFDSESLVTVRLAEGVQAVAGKLEELKSGSWLARSLDENEVQSLEEVKAQNMEKDTEKDAAATDEQEVETTEETSEATDDAATEETEKTAPEVEALAEMISAKTSAGVVAGLTPVLEAITTSMKGVAEALVSKQTDAAEEETEKASEETLETSSDDTETDTDTIDMAKTLAALQTQLVETQKSVSALSKAVPAQPAREEKVETEKSQETDEDLNSCFDTLWPMFKQA